MVGDRLFRTVVAVIFHNRLESCWRRFNCRDGSFLTASYISSSAPTYHRERGRVPSIGDADRIR